MRTSLGIVSLFLLSMSCCLGQQYTISTVAGGAPIPTPAVALNSPLGGPGAVAADSAGNVYFGSNHAVYKIDSSGNMTRIAGTARIGFSGDGAPATNAQLNNPGGLAADNAGNLYIADSGNHRIRKVTLSNGTITTIAGTGTPGFSGDNGPAVNAALNNPQGLALDSNGNLYIADSGNNVIRRIIATNGAIGTVAGNGTAGAGGDNSPGTSAQLNMPTGVAVDVLGSIYIADANNNKVRAVRSGIMSTIAGTGAAGFGGDNGLATAAQLNLPTAVGVDGSGNIYVTDFNNTRVRKIASSGVITNLTVGSGITTPAGIGVDPGGNVIIADTNGSQLLKYTPTGGFSILAGNRTRYFLGEGGKATDAQLAQPQGMAVNGLGVYIADRGESLIRQISPGGTIMAPPGVAGNLIGPAGVAADAANTLYVADAGSNKIYKISAGGSVTLLAGTGAAGIAGDNGPAQLAQLNQPNGVGFDAAGNVYVADTGNNRIRKITTATGIISTIAGNGTPGFGGDNGVSTGALVNQPAGIAVDGSGNIYIADTGNNRIRKISNTGTITTVAGNGTQASSGDGGPATGAAIASPHGVAFDSLGNIYITDSSGRIRKVSVGGLISTIAGTGAAGYSGDGGPALSAQLSQPWGIALDANRAVYVSDAGEQAVRLLLQVPGAALSITSSSPLPSGTIGLPYAQTLQATGGTAPYTWSVVFGTLPAGLTLSPSGSITGTPSTSGSFLLTFQVTDSDSVIQTATIGLVIAPSSPAGLTITTPPTLVPGAVGVSYSQPLTAAAGTAPYTWSILSGALPTGLSLSPTGLISGAPVQPGTSSFTIRVTDNTGAATTQTFNLTILSIGTLSRTGVFGHIALGGPWTTRMYLTNVSNSPVAVNLMLHADDGTALSVPMTVTLQGTSQQLSTSLVTSVLNANTTMVIDSGAQVASTITGWIDVLSSGAQNSLAGFAIFHTLANGQTSEGTSPLQTQFGSKMVVPFDNTGGFVTGVAVANLSTSAATITATVLDLNGNQIGTYSLQLAANGHTSFLFPSQFAVSTNQQGIVQFSSNSGGSLAGVGLRATATAGTFTSVPVILP